MHIKLIVKFTFNFINGIYIFINNSKTIYIYNLTI